MASIVRNITFDCADPYQLALFWSEVVGHPLNDDDHPGDPVAVISPPGGPTLYFAQVPEGKRDEPRTDSHFNVRTAGGPSLQVEPYYESISRQY